MLDNQINEVYYNISYVVCLKQCINWVWPLAGNYGNELDAKPPTKLFADDEEEEEGDTSDKAPLVKKRKEESMPPTFVQHSMTRPEKPSTFDSNYFHMQYEAEKPCIYVTCYYEDLRKRIYNEIALGNLSAHLVSSLMHTHSSTVKYYAGLHLTSVLFLL